MKTFICSKCLAEKPEQTNGGTGYAINDNKEKICYGCCGEIDRQFMRDNGKATLYLSLEGNDATKGFVTNWPNTLRLPVYGLRKGYHNIAGKRFDFWFNFNGKQWHGVQYGENTQIAHCKQLKN